MSQESNNEKTKTKRKRIRTKLCQRPMEWDEGCSPQPRSVKAGKRRQPCRSAGHSTAPILGYNPDPTRKDQNALERSANQIPVSAIGRSEPGAGDNFPEHSMTPPARGNSAINKQRSNVLRSRSGMRMVALPRLRSRFAEDHHHPGRPRRSSPMAKHLKKHRPRNKLRRVRSWIARTKSSEACPATAAGRRCFQDETQAKTPAGPCGLQARLARRAPPLTRLPSIHVPAVLLAHELPFNFVARAVERNQAGVHV